MQTVIEALRSILGEPDFYKILEGSYNNNYSWDYNAMFEYFVASMIVIIVVGSIFKIVTNLFRR